MPELDRIKTQKNLDDNQRGTEVASHLYDRIYGKKAEEDRVQCLIDICDVLESREVQNDDLKEIGASMRSTIPSKLKVTLLTPSANDNRYVRQWRKYCS